jgi:hypothetical protein
MEGLVGGEKDLEIGPTELGIKVLQEACMSEQRAGVCHTVDEADDRRPAIGFSDPVADLDLYRRVSAPQGRAACQANRSLFGSGKVQPEGRRDPVGEDGIVGASIQDAGAHHGAAGL